MALDLGNDRAGQFFTPYHISSMMAKMLCGDVKAQCKARGYVSLMEPAVGAGGMVIAMAEAFADEGINYQRAMHATCIDVDAAAVHMAYIQLSLLHIPAIIIYGNALSNEQWGYWVTPAHVLGFWNSRLKRNATDDQTKHEEEGGDCPALVMPAIVSHQVRELVKATKDNQQMILF